MIGSRSIGFRVTLFLVQILVSLLVYWVVLSFLVCKIPPPQVVEELSGRCVYKCWAFGGCFASVGFPSLSSGGPCCNPCPQSGQEAERSHSKPLLSLMSQTHDVVIS